MKKTYQQIMPMDEDSTVISQFGWLPLSVFKPVKSPSWDNIIKDDGDELQTRRGANVKYLPNLRYSKFHPHLAEVVVRYWSEKNDLVVDPFAGRTTRGLVSLELKRRYEGYEVAPLTYKKTRGNILPLGGKIYLEDGCYMKNTSNYCADLVFTCPPYHDLEKYEVVENQLSEETSYEGFLDKIDIAMRNMRRVLKNDGFVCWVCADWRKKGKLIMFHKDSIDLFEKNGFTIHDIVVIQNNSPFAALQAGKVASKRYTSKVHEYLIVARKK